MTRFARLLSLVCLAAFCVCAHPTYGSIIRVKPDGDDANDGSSWALAKKAVLFAAVSSAKGDEIWVSAGTYYGRVSIKDGVGLYGGFAGTETDRGQRDPRAHVTTLDGSDTAWVIVAPPGVTSSAHIDGFTIQNGGDSGILCNGSSPVISNNLITRNRRSAVNCHVSSAAIIACNTIVDNTGENGGGVGCYLSSPVIIGNLILANSATRGGAISCDQSSPTIVNNTIAGNTSNKGGAIRCLANSSPVLQNSGCQYFFINCHGDYSGVTSGSITRLFLTASKHVLYAHKWPGAPPENSPDPDKPGWFVAYAKEELSRNGNPMRLVWIEACLNGRNGAYRSSDEGDPNYGKYGKFSCYETNTLYEWNDMAEALGIDRFAANEVRCGYVAYYEAGRCGGTYVGGSGLTGMTVRAWNLLADGRTFAQTRDWIDENAEGYYYKVPKPDARNLLRPEYPYVAPFYNWRFWGNRNVSLF